jgi:hypothetical protein
MPKMPKTSYNSEYMQALRAIKTSYIRRTLSEISFKEVIVNRTDVEYVLHCVKNASELISQGESEKAKGLLLSGGLLLLEKLTSDNSGYAKCEHCKEYYDDMKDGINFCPHCGSELKKHFA